MQIVLYKPLLYSQSDPYRILHVATLSQKFQHTFIGAKHDGSARHDTEHVGHKSTIKCGHALFFPDESKTLSETGILLTSVLLGCLP